MKWPRSMAWVPAASLLLTGCVSSDPVRFNAKVRQWVPLGTPVADAERIMQHHGFDCHRITANNPFNPGGAEYLDCGREQFRLHDWNARFIIRDGKVAEYGRITTN